MKSSNPKELFSLAKQLHGSVPNLSQGEEVSEQSSQGIIRYTIMKLTPYLQLKWGVTSKF